MKSTVCGVLTGALLLAGTAFAQTAPDQYLALHYLQVKPGKGGEFQSIARRIADANRRYKGSDWIAFARVFGEEGNYMMVAPRQNYAAIDRAHTMFVNALSEAFSPSGVAKLMDEAGSLLTSSRSELHRRRMDLSWNAPDDLNELSKIVGGARWTRVMTIKVKPGRNAEFEEALRTVKDNAEKASPRLMTLVSQSVLGTDGTEFRLSAVRKSLADYDQNPTPSLKESLGDEGYRKWQNLIAETTQGTSTALYVIVPEVSSPAEQIASADPSFWNPKPVVAGGGRRGKQSGDTADRSKK